MSQVDDLYQRYTAEYRDAGDADPRPFLEQLTGVDRAELSLRIDRFLEAAPPPAFDAGAFAVFRSDAKREAMVRRLITPATLRQLREQAQLSKPDTAAALAEQLAVVGREAAVKSRYHDLESGNVDPATVRSRVWDALGALFKAPADALRDAAFAAFGGSVAAPGAAFARSSYKDTGAVLEPLARPGASVEGDAVVDRAFFKD